MLKVGRRLLLQHHDYFYGHRRHGHDHIVASKVHRSQELVLVDVPFSNIIIIVAIVTVIVVV